MKTKLIAFYFFSAIIILLGWHDNGFSQKPLPDIRVNNTDGLLVLAQPNTLSISVALNNNGITDIADWWFAAATPSGVLFLTPNGWSSEILPAYQGPLFQLPAIELLNIPASGFLAGVYAYYFGVDTHKDGTITWDSLYWDVAVVNLTDLAGPSQIPLSHVPLEIHRRAAQLLEDMRESEMAPGWEKAQLSQEVRPFYRPDIESIAYYEFEVEPAGFIILSTGDHDHPIPHWSATGVTISEELERKALEAGKQAVKLFKMDALFYAAEDGQGELTATVGNTLVKISGMDPEWLNLEEIPLTEVIAQPEEEIESDDQAQEITYQVQVTGQVSSPIQFEDWGSWRELKAGYIESYKVLIDVLRRDADEDWESENTVKEFGEGLQTGETYRLALLHPGAQWEVFGKGTEFARVNLLEREGLPPVLEITAVDSPPEGMAVLDFSITYPNDLGETLKFVILDPSMLQSSEPEATKSRADQTNHLISSRSFVSAVHSSKWSKWTIYWAGSRDDQRLYHQYKISYCIGSWCWDCASGCGATAWATLFGWADHQAWIGNSYWKKRNGLYLQNGGKWPAPDADAPQDQKKGVENITKEIRNYAGSWCFSFTGQSATEPWNMYKAYKYFISRTGTGLKTDYSSWGINWNSLRVKARNAIRDRKTPAIIGTGWLAHYPVAWAYAFRHRTVKTCGICWWDKTEYQRWFYVNQGQGSSKNEWVSADTWFVGEIYPACIPGTWCWAPYP